MSESVPLRVLRTTKLYLFNHNMSWVVRLPFRLQLLSTSRSTDADEDIWQKQLHRCEQSANEGKNQMRPNQGLPRNVSCVQCEGKEEWGNAIIATDLTSMFIDH